MKRLICVFVILLAGCSSSSNYSKVQQSEVNPFAQELDLAQKILVKLPQNVSQKDYRAFLDNIPQELKSYGFLEVWDTDSHDIELKTAGLTDFTTESKKKSLFENLGVYYLLDIEVVERKPFKYGKLSSQLEYKMQQTPGSGGNVFPNIKSDYWVVLKYTLYQTDYLDKVAQIEIKASHNDDNTLNSRKLRRDINTLFEHIYATTPY